MNVINNIIIDGLNKKDNSDNVPPGWFLEKVEAVFNDKENATETLQRLREIMKIVSTVKQSRKDWPEIQEWRKILPEWLLKTFRQEYTEEEIKQLLKNKLQRTGWTLEDWRFYMKDKVWEWWDGKTESNRLIVKILVDGHPFSIYELKSLLELCGAISVKLL